MRSKSRVALLVLATLVLATLVIVWWHASSALPEQIITLPNGEQYRFAGVTYSKEPIPPSMLAQIVHHLPNSWVRRLDKYVAPYVSQMNSGGSYDTPQLFVWFTRVGTNFPPARSTTMYWGGFLSGPVNFGPPYRTTPTAVLADESGNAAGVLIQPQLTTNAVWSSLSFSVLPRRSRTLECNFYSFGQIHDRFSVIAKVRFRNPAYKRYPQWEPEAIPSTKQSGLLRVRLDSVIYENPYTNLSQTGVHWPQTAVSYTLLGDDGWTRIRSELSDATGNRIADAPQSYPFYYFNNRPQTEAASSRIQNLREAGTTAIFDGVPWPGENAWHLKMEFKRDPRHGTGRQITFTNVLLPPAASNNAFNFTNWESGHPIVMRRNGWGSGGNERSVNFEISGQLTNQAVTVVAARTEEGPVTSFSENESPKATQISIEYHNSPTNMTVTLELEKIETVEFLVKPPR